MKATVYLRMAKQKRINGARPFKVDAATRPSGLPLRDSALNPLPTICFGIDVNIPDAAFEQAARVIAELTIPDDAFDVAVADVQVKP